ncbi:MAG: hypothetical protein RL030_965, partial [Pseudomonadota bacterium]
MKRIATFIAAGAALIFAGQAPCATP